jgi:hypothetical protein
MNSQEAFKIIKFLKVSYPNFYKDVTLKETEDIIETWAMIFSEERFDVVAEAVKSCVVANKFPPSIAEIIEKIDIIKGKNKNDNSGIEAWNKVAKAISDSNYNAGKYFEEFDDLIKNLVGSPNQLRQWAIMDFTTLEVVKSHFLKSYKMQNQKDVDYNKLPDTAKNLAERLSKDDILKLDSIGRLKE